MENDDWQFVKRVYNKLHGIPDSRETEMLKDRIDTDLINPTYTGMLSHYQDQAAMQGHRVNVYPMISSSTPVAQPPNVNAPATLGSVEESEVGSVSMLLGPHGTVAGSNCRWDELTYVICERLQWMHPARSRTA